MPAWAVLVICSEAPSDQLAMHLVGAFPDLRDLGVAHQPLDAVVADIAVAAVHLHGLGGHAHGEVGGPQLGDRGLEAEIGRAAVDQIGDMVEPGLAHGELGREIGQHELVALELDDARPDCPRVFM